MKKIVVILIACWLAAALHFQTSAQSPAPSLSPQPASSPIPSASPEASADKPSATLAPRPRLSPVVLPNASLSPQPSAQSSEERPRVGRPLKSQARKFYPPGTEPMNSPGGEPLDSRRIIHKEKPEPLRKNASPAPGQDATPSPNGSRENAGKKDGGQPAKVLPTPTPSPVAE